VAELPSGTVTLLFTDLEGSTRLWEEHHAVMVEVLARHDVIVRGAVEDSGGHVVKYMGDGCLAVFATAEVAVAAVGGPAGDHGGGVGCRGRFEGADGIAHRISGAARR